MDIPVELLTGIFQDLPARDLAALALTSTSLRNIVQPLLYRHVRVSDDAAAEEFHRYRTFGQNFDTSVPIDVPTSFKSSYRTIMSLPHLGSIVRSLEITEDYQAMSVADIKTLLLAIPRLSCLTLHCDEIEDIEECSIAISPHLNEFTSCSVEIDASFFRFLDSHPEITAWRYGVMVETLPHLDIPDASVDALSRLRTYETATLHPSLEHIRMVSCMTSLTRLSIRYDLLGHFISRENPAVLRSFEDMFSRCGTNLIILSLYGPSLNNNDSPLPWILNKILRHTPVLRHLNLTHVQRTGTMHTQVQYDPIETMDPDMFKDTSLPPSLEILTWELRLVPFPCPFKIVRMSEIDDLSAAGLANAKLLFSIIPSLATLVYAEEDLFHVFRRARDGDVTYAGKDTVREWYDPWWVQVQGYWNRIIGSEICFIHLYMCNTLF